MDPNVTLAELLAWAHHAEPETDQELDAMNTFLDLHEWLVNGGFPPDVWVGVDTD